MAHNYAAKAAATKKAENAFREMDAVIANDARTPTPKEGPLIQSPNSGVLAGRGLPPIRQGRLPTPSDLILVYIPCLYHSNGFA